MAANDSRSRRKRSSTRYQTRQASGVINWNPGANYLSQDTTTANDAQLDRNWSQSDSPMESNDQTYGMVNTVPLAVRRRNDQGHYDHVRTYAPGQVYARDTGEGNNGITRLETIGVENVTKTMYKAGDNRNKKDSSKDSDAEKANRKKKGRSGLRIKRKADQSAGRIKNQDTRVKKKSGAQGGGPTGLNIPR